MGLLNESDRNNLYRIIHDAAVIRTHFHYFIWLQRAVREFLPHDILLACWGDFESHELRFDISSALPGVRTGQYCNRPDLVPWLLSLQERWSGLDRRPYILRQRDSESAFGAFLRLDGGARVTPRSIMVHGVDDRRLQHVCLYAFVNVDNDFSEDALKKSALVLPYIDAVLRRLEALPATPKQIFHPTRILPGFGMQEISEREQEILKWVCFGKTNAEIAIILGISPNTVKNHLGRIFDKLGVRNRTQAVALAQAHAEAA